jgi:hypothetical protein
VAKKKSSQKSSSKKTSVKQAISSVGSNLSIGELNKAVKSTGKDPLTIMSQGLKQGVSLGQKVVNAYNTGNLPNYRYQGTPDNLAGLKGLQLGKGQVYQGSSSTITPSSRTPNAGYTPGKATYNPIVSVKNQAGPAKNQSKGGGGNTGGGSTGGGGISKTPNPNKELKKQIKGLEEQLGINQANFNDILTQQGIDFQTRFDDQQTGFQDIINQSQLGYQDQMAGLSAEFNAAIAAQQEQYALLAEQYAAQAKQEEEAARAFMINQGRSVMPANLQLGAAFGTPRLAGTQGFKYQPRATATPSQVATAFTAPTLAATGALPQQPSVLNI